MGDPTALRPAGSSGKETLPSQFPLALPELMRQAFIPVPFLFSDNSQMAGLRTSNLAFRSSSVQKAAELNLKGKWLKDKEVLKQQESRHFLF